MGTPRLTLTIVRAGPENTWGSPAVLHDSLQHTHTSVWPRERLFFFFSRENVVVARVPLNHSTNGWYLFLHSSGTRLKTDESTIRRPTVEKNNFWGGKKKQGRNSRRRGQVLTSSGQAEWKVSSGWHQQQRYSFHLAPYVVHGWRRKNAETPARRNGRLLHPITSSNRRRRHLVVDFYTSLTRLPTDAHFSSRLENFGISWKLLDVSNHLQLKMSARQTPNEFLKQIIGRPVVVKLNNGVDYRGKSCQTHGWILSCIN